MRHHRLFRKSQRTQRGRASPIAATDRVVDLGFDRPAATASPKLATPIRDAAVAKKATRDFFRAKALSTRD